MQLLEISAFVQVSVNINFLKVHDEKMGAK